MQHHVCVAGTRPVILEGPHLVKAIQPGTRIHLSKAERVQGRCVGFWTVKRGGKVGIYGENAGVRECSEPTGVTEGCQHMCVAVTPSALSTHSLHKPTQPAACLPVKCRHTHTRTHLLVGLPYGVLHVQQLPAQQQPHQAGHQCRLAVSKPHGEEAVDDLQQQQRWVVGRVSICVSENVSGSMRAWVIWVSMCRQPGN